MIRFEAALVGGLSAIMLHAARWLHAVGEFCMPPNPVGDFLWVHTKTRAICFYMRAGSRIIQCAISADALAGMVHYTPSNNAERLTAFARCRKRIEQLASEKFDRGGEEPIALAASDIQ